MLALIFALILLVHPAMSAVFEPLTIQTKKGPVAFTVEMATTPAERAKGLMYRTELAPNAGMLFDFGVEQPIYMWMKNTYIPLDMVFIRADGRIASIAENTTPLSTQTIESGGSVKAVLELAGGTAKARGLAVGDQVVHPLFAPK
ncbi:hypothetical protein FHS55_002090 [Angulomicrobium tetraedrale]|uniref:DUF192 domain-containing protein n=1 Tax=Ancylobacter tetraedralis TaxID=217068 RepID=A0A839Z9S8_9HYPH|nr:hypothetical protein [Ancylobacter tetraedralis]